LSVTDPFCSVAGLAGPLSAAATQKCLSGPSTITTKRIAANIAKLPESGLILISLKAAFHRWDNFLRFDQSFQIEEIRDVVVFVERRDYVVERIHYALFAICSDFRMAFSSI